MVARWAIQGFRILIEYQSRATRCPFHEEARMNVELKYCSMWNYEPQAVSLTAKLLNTYKQKIKSLTLIPSGGGCFELTVNGQLLYSKLKTGNFPTEEWVIDVVGKAK
jgi:selenoprotein W-related protein